MNVIGTAIPDVMIIEPVEDRRFLQSISDSLGEDLSGSLFQEHTKR